MNAFGRDLDHVRELATELALTLARDLEHAHELALAHVRAAERARENSPASRVARALNRAQTRARALACTRELAPAHVRAGIARDLAHARASARPWVPDRDRDRYLDLTNAIDHAKVPFDELVDVLSMIQAAPDSGEIHRAPAPNPAPSAGEIHRAPASSPGRAAGQVAGIAVRVLPAGHQARYREEFAAELYDVAEAGASRWRQLAYALRLLDRAWMLRAELRAPAHRRAGT
jgi:hypothetical protein